MTLSERTPPPPTKPGFVKNEPPNIEKKPVEPVEPVDKNPVDSRYSMYTHAFTVLTID